MDEYTCNTCGKEFGQWDVENCEECKQLEVQAKKDFKHEEYYEYKGEWHER